MNNLEDMTDEQLEREYWRTASAAEAIARRELEHGRINKEIIKREKRKLPKI